VPVPFEIVPTIMPWLSMPLASVKKVAVGSSMVVVKTVTGMFRLLVVQGRSSWRRHVAVARSSTMRARLEASETFRPREAHRGFPRRNYSSRLFTRSQRKSPEAFIAPARCSNAQVDGAVVGRIFKANAAPVGTPWMWTLAFGQHDDRSPTHAMRQRVRMRWPRLPRAGGGYDLGDLANEVAAGLLFEQSVVPHGRSKISPGNHEQRSRDKAYEREQDDQQAASELVSAHAFSDGC
jgi:hypothetical protein